MLYIFHGPNDFARNEKIAELQARLGDPSVANLNMARLNGREVNLSEIRHHADAMPFMADRRLVIVHGYLTRPEEMPSLIDYLGRLPPTTDLVLAESELVNKDHPLLKAAADIGAIIVSFANLDRNELRAWIMRSVQERGAAIEPGAADLLARLVGANLRLLNQEIEKLTLYVGGQRPIQPADIDLLVPYAEEAEDFGLANALGQRHADRAYDQLHKLLEEGKHPMGILGSIAAQIRGLLEVKDLAERGLSAQEIAKAKGWRSDYAAKMRLREAANFSASRLEAILELLLEIDLDIKTGKVESLLALDILVARLCLTPQFESPVARG
jgi:DNA polymerase-3 subunit delta